MSEHGEKMCPIFQGSKCLRQHCEWWMDDAAKCAILCLGMAAYFLGDIIHQDLPRYRNLAGSE